MDTNFLGPFPVHRIGFGAMQLPGPGVLGPPRDHDEAIAVLRRAVELGVDHIDTAQFYGPDVANELIREALHPYPEGLVLVSKVGAFRDEQGGWLPGQRPEQLRSAVEDNLRSLGHRPARGGEPAADGLPRARAPGRPAGGPRGPARGDGRAARRGQDRRYRHLHRHPGPGRAGHHAGRHRLRPERLQPGRPDRRRRAGPVPRLRRRVRAVLPARVRVPGLPKVTDNAAVRALAARIGTSPAQVGLAWLLAYRDNVLLIPGTSSVAHLEENMNVTSISLTNDDITGLQTITQSHAE